MVSHEVVVIRLDRAMSSEGLTGASTRPTHLAGVGRPQLLLTLAKFSIPIMQAFLQGCSQHGSWLSPGPMVHENEQGGPHMLYDLAPESHTVTSAFLYSLGLNH